ncbi:MAG: hypothetical protein ACK40X_04715 [Armatimonadota bacterium]
MSTWLVGENLHCQTVQTPPSWTMAEQVTSLLNNPELPNHWQLATRAAIYASNNVLPLKLGDDEKLPQTRFNDNQAFYVSHSLKDLALTRKRWTLRYGYGQANFYQGNRGAAQLYLDSKSDGIDWSKSYDVNASLKRTRLYRWTVEYLIPFKHGRGEILLAIHWLRVHRLQEGTLTGQMWLGQFQGDLTLLTTRGLPRHETRSNGLALDIAAIAPVNDRIRVGFWSENIFSRIWQRTVQRVTAKVSTNTIEPDADGFLHAVPFLQGRIDRISSRVKAKQIWTIGATLRQDRNEWILWILIFRRERDWQVGVGYSFPIGHKKRVWVMISEHPRFLQVGINTTQLQLLVGIDKLNASTTKGAMMVARWLWSF